MQTIHLDTSSQSDIQVAYSRAAYHTLMRLNAAQRTQVTRLVNIVATNAGQIAQRASTTFSADAGPSLRVIFLRAAGALTVLALAGSEALK